MRSNFKPESIRFGEMKDVTTIAEFMIRLAWETESVSLDRPTVHAGVMQAMTDPVHGFYVVATADDAVIGCMMITCEWSDWRNAKQWWMQSVYVDSHYRRQGVFRKLYKFVEKLAMEQADVCGLRLYVEKDNTQAQNTYGSLGMERTDYLVYEAQMSREPAAAL